MSKPKLREGRSCKVEIKSGRARRSMKTTQEEDQGSTKPNPKPWPPWPRRDKREEVQPLKRLVLEEFNSDEEEVGHLDTQ